jgi:hypothetical protein
MSNHPRRPAEIAFNVSTGALSRTHNPTPDRGTR